MRSISLTATAALLTSLTLASPMKRAAGGLQAVYWGNNNGGARSLASYCAAGQGIDILVLAFIDGYGNGNPPSGFFNSNPSCTINTDGSSTGCDQMAQDITTCQAAGVKVLLSLGGGGGSGSVTSQADAEQTATYLWDWFGNPAYSTDASGPRPFGSARVDGFDLDVEADPAGANTNYQYLVAKLRSLWAQDTANTYVVTGAPQCPLPEANMGSMIESFAFDYLFVQFYNNHQVCDASLYVKKDVPYASFNYDDWATYLDKTPSSSAQIFIGVPASTGAATSISYVAPEDLAPLVNEYKTHPKFGGLMEWEASQSDTLNDNGNTFAQEVRCILDKGTTC